MTSHTGYLLIADISGYTAYLTSSEQEHANPILKSLLTTLVENIDEPLHFGGMSGAFVSIDRFFVVSTQFRSLNHRNLSVEFPTNKQPFRMVLAGKRTITATF